MFLITPALMFATIPLCSSATDSATRAMPLPSTIFADPGTTEPMTDES